MPLLFMMRGVGSGVRAVRAPLFAIAIASVSISGVAWSADYSCPGEKVSGLDGAKKNASASYSEDSNSKDDGYARYFKFTTNTAGTVTVAVDRSGEDQKVYIGTSCDGHEIAISDSGDDSYTHTFDVASGTTYYIKVEEDNGWWRHYLKFDIDFTLVTKADLEFVEKSAPTPNPAVVGETVTFSTKGINHGPSTAYRNIVATFKYNMDVEIDSVNPAAGFTCDTTSGTLSAGSYITCTKKSVWSNLNATKNFYIGVKPLDDGTLTQTAKIVSTVTTDPNMANNTIDSSVTVNRTNHPPTDIALSNDDIDENNAVGDLIGTLTTTDPDSTDTTFTYTIVGGDTSSFKINGDRLEANEVFDYETKNSYSIRIKTDDGHGGTYEEDFTIKINDRREADISVVEYATPNPSNPSVGEETKFYVRVLKDSSNDSAGPIKLKISYDQDVELVSVSQVAGGGDFSCDITSGSLSAGSVITCTKSNTLATDAPDKDFEIVLKPTAEGTLTQSVELVPTTNDPDMSNNSYTSDVEVYKENIPNCGDGTHGLLGQYFNDTSLDGDIALERTDADIDFDWGTGAPDSSVNADSFSTIWTGYLAVAESANYIFSLAHDDKMKLYIDGNLVYDGASWTGGSNNYKDSGSVNLSAGCHKLKIEYVELGGGAYARIKWRNDAHIRGSETISTDYLYKNNPPSADAGADITVRIDDTFTVDGSASTDSDAGDSIASYRWYDDNGTEVATTATYSDSYSSEGNYTFTLEVTDGFGAKGRDTVIVHVIENRPPVADAGADQSANQGDTVTLDGSNSSDPDGDSISFEWRNEYDEVISTDATFSKDDYTVGEHEITLIVTDSKGASSKDTVIVNIDGEVDAKDNYYSTDSQSIVIGNVITDAPVDEGSNLKVTAHTDPSSGTLSLEENGSFTYTPDASFEGNVSFDYTIEKKSGFRTYSDTARVFIEVKRYSGKPRYQNEYTCGVFSNVLVSYTSISSSSSDDRACGTMKLSYPDGQISGEVECFAAPDCTGANEVCGQQEPPANIYTHDFVDTNVTGDNDPVDPGDSTPGDIEGLYYGNLKYAKADGKTEIHFSPKDTYEDNPTNVLVAGDLTVNGGYTLSFEPGDYYFRSISFEGEGNTIVLPNDGVVRIFVKNDLQINLKNFVMNADTDSRAGDLFIYVGGDFKSIGDGGGDTTMKAFIYTKGEVNLKNDSTNWKYHGGLTAEGAIKIDGNNPDFIQDSDADDFGLGKCKMCYSDISVGGMSFNFMNCGGFSMMKDIRVPIHSNEEVTNATVDEVHDASMFSFSFMQTNDVIDQDGNKVADATTTSSGWNNGAMGMDTTIFGGKAVTYPVGNPYGPANDALGYNQLHNSSMFDMGFDPCKWGKSLVYVAHYDDKDGRHYDVELSKCEPPEGGFCETYGLDEGFHMIDPDGGDKKNMFEIYCDTQSDLAKKYGARDLIALPIKQGKDKNGNKIVNRTNNFVYESNSTETVNYYQEAKDHGLDFDAIEINANKMEVVIRDDTPENPVTATGTTPEYKTMGTTFSNINLLGTPFTIDWDHTVIKDCNVSTLRKAYHGQAVKVNLLKDKDHVRCRIESMKLKILDDYQYVEYKDQEVLERTCKEFSEQVPIDVMSSSDIKGHFWITPHQTTRESINDITRASERPIVAYCWYQTDLDWAWTFLLSLDGEVTNSKNDVTTGRDTCSQLGLYFFVPNTKDSFNRVRKYLKEMKDGDLGWENYTGTIREKYKTYTNNPNKEYYLQPLGYEKIWPYGPMGIYYPCRGNHDATNNCESRRWYPGHIDERGWMSGSPMHNIEGESNYPDSMGAKGWVSLLGEQDLNVTNEWWISDIGAGEEVGYCDGDSRSPEPGSSYSPSGTHRCWYNNGKYYEPNGNYTKEAWLNFVHDSEGWVYHNDDNNDFYAYYDYMCMADTNYIRTHRSYSPAGYFNIVRPAGAETIMANGEDPEPQDNAVENALYMQIAGVDYNLTALALDKNTTTGKITALHDYRGLVGVELIQTPSYRDSDTHEERVEKCNGALALTLPTTTMAFDGSARSITDLQTSYPIAYKNLSYRVKYLKNPDYPDEAIAWDCANDTYGCIWDTLSVKIYDSTKCNESTGYPESDCPCAVYCKPASGHENDPASDTCKQCIFQREELAGAACSRDEFSIRPKEYILTPDRASLKLTTQEYVNYKIVAVDNDGNATDGYIYHLDMISNGVLDINYTLTIDGCNGGDIDTNGTLYFSRGNSRVTDSNGTAEYALGVTFDDVGELNISVADHNWTIIDKEDNDCIPGESNNTRDASGKFGCDVAGSSNGLEFLPASFDINASITPQNASGFTYIAQDLNVSSKVDVTVRALNKDGNVTVNYNSACYAKNWDLNVGYNINGSAPSATNPDNLTQIIYAVTDDNGTTVRARTLENIDGSIALNNISRDTFSTDHNGSAVVRMMVNFDRNMSAPVLPFELNVTDFSARDTDGVAGALSTALGSDYYYARFKSSKDLYDDVTENSIKTPVSVVVYYVPGSRIGNATTINTANFGLTDEYDWYLSRRHSGADGNVTLVTTDTSKGTVSAPSLSGGRDGDVLVSAVSTVRPLTVDVNLTGTDSWLIYNPNGEVEPAPFYRVRFIGGGMSDWAGYGQTGRVIDTNISRQKSNRLEW